MNVPTKFKINTEEFKVYFDNKGKTHVCENVQTGEKTNIGVIGILLQMGILKEIDDKSDQNVRKLTERINSLENKIVELSKHVENINETDREEIPRKEVEIKEVEKEEAEENIEEEPEETIEEEPEEKEVEVKEKPQSEIKERIMKRVMKQAEEKEEAEEDSNVKKESEEEINNWMDI